MTTARHLGLFGTRGPQIIRRAPTCAALALAVLTTTETGCLSSSPDEQNDASIRTEVDPSASPSSGASAAGGSTDSTDGTDASETDVDYDSSLHMPSSSTPSLLTRLTLTNPTATARSSEPIRVGIPLPKSAQVKNVDDLTLYDDHNRPVPLQATALARWTSGPNDPASPLRWVLLSFQASVPGSSSVQYSLNVGGAAADPASRLTASDDGTQVTISTGAATFVLNRGASDLFTSVTAGGVQLLKPGNGLELKDSQGHPYRADLSQAIMAVESVGRNEAVLRISGSHVPTGSSSSLLDYTLRLTFHAGHSDVRIAYTLLNPDSALHTGNFWPLGDVGSRYLEDVSLQLPLKGSGTPGYTLWTGEKSLSGNGGQPVAIYQDSSGGQNYLSKNHEDANRWVPIQFQGYRVTAGNATVASGLRAQPWLDASRPEGGIAVGVRQFWQNFPKALSWTGTNLRVGLFPTEYAGTFEIQGGEQKTHEIEVYFHAGPANTANLAATMSSLSDPILVTPAQASWYQTTGAFLYEDAPRQGQRGAAGTLEATMDTVAYPTGSVQRSYMTQWEVIDAYDWRNFGDVQADHEASCGSSSTLDSAPISHYNDQYDYVFGALNLYGRTLDPKFLEFGLATARHTLDIDIDHAKGDFDGYAGGMFWHTTHDTPADTSSHRSYPVSAVSSPCTQYGSGGPGLGHLYVDGLMAYYFLTGDPLARDAVVELANFGYARHTTYGDETDGRSIGNYLQTMVNAYRLTGSARYYNAAVTVINSNVASIVASSDGSSWFDGMTGVALGRFLDLKMEREQTGDADATAARNLLRTFCDKVMNASSRLPMDVNLARWSDVLAYGYKHVGNGAYWGEAKAIYGELGSQYWGRGTYPNAKELAILLHNGHLTRAYLAQGK